MGYLSFVEQVAFRVGGLTIHWYGVLVAAGFLAGLWTASRRAPLAGVKSEIIVDFGPWLMVAAVAGARLLYVVSYWQQDFANQAWYEIFMIQHGGLVFYGGLIGASLATVFYARAKDLPLWRLADVFAPSIVLGHAFGRFGCFANGCCYGSPTQLPWAINYPVGHLAHGASVHPTQMYEALLNLGVYSFLAWKYRRRDFDGQVFALYLLGYGGVRFAVEFFRGDYPVRYLGGWATPAQLVSVAVIAAGIALWHLLAPKAPAN